MLPKVRAFHIHSLTSDHLSEFKAKMRCGGAFWSTAMPPGSLASASHTAFHLRIFNWKYRGLKLGFSAFLAHQILISYDTPTPEKTFSPLVPDSHGMLSNMVSDFISLHVKYKMPLDVNCQIQSNSYYLSVIEYKRGWGGGEEGFFMLLSMIQIS